MRILLPVDGSEHSERVARHAILLAKNSTACEILLLNVQPPVDALEVLGHMPLREIEAMQETRGGDALAPARALLDAAGVAYEPMVVLGPVAGAIAEVVRVHTDNSSASLNTQCSHPTSPWRRNSSISIRSC